MPPRHPQGQPQGQPPPSSGQSTVLEALINQPQYPSAPQMGPGGHMGGPMDSQHDQQQVYNQKLRMLRPYCENLKLRAQQCRMEGNMEAAQKLETMLGVLEGRRVVSLEYLLNLENWIHKKADFLAATTHNPHAAAMQNGHMGMTGQGMVDGINANKPSVPEAARRELSQLSDRFEFDNNSEPHHDPHSALVKCKINAFFYDDLQNVVHERLARPGLHSVTEFLNTWESTVRQYTSNQNNANTTISPFEDLFQNYDNIIT
ncbi:unnamed protein product [Nippostrongylus brasiliensis]|uniref:Mediator of RNA polymerase II transcription subunit 15 n=1 Tax=Nippostrongylus brasiliensis TaxID=27835 RepID=A0A0N4YPU3_NIPBR|nr:unnamed protein product [Nippostrongylus brasiliensis]